MAYLKIFVLLLCAFGAYKAIGGIMWIPFVMFAVFVTMRDFATKNNSTLLQKMEASVKFGIIGEYIVDGENAYGLYLMLHGKGIFVDIKRDALVLGREKVALELFEKQLILEDELKKFLLKYDEFKADQIDSFGIHSDNLNQVEVFWESGEYTILRNMVFVID